MIDIWLYRWGGGGGGGGVKYHSLSYWSIFMSSPVEFLISEFRVLENGITNQEKNKGLYGILV